MRSPLQWLGSLLVLLLAAAPEQPPVLRGYSAPASRAERDWEAKFRAIPSPETLRETMRHLSARPHHVGPPYDKANSERIHAPFRSWGFDAAIEVLKAHIPTP